MRRYFFYSLFSHFAIFLALIFISSTFFINMFQILGKKDQVNYSAPSIRVDIISMPRLTLKEERQLKVVPLKDPAEALKVQTVPKDPAEGAGGNTPAAQVEKDPNELEIEGLEKKKKLNELLKKLSEKSLSPSEAPSRKNGFMGSKKLQEATEEEVKNLLLAGNILSKGTSVTGTGQKGEVSDFTVYSEALLGQIRPFWKLPGYLNQQKLKCRIRLYLSHDGQIIQVLIYESSGVAQYDEKALNAVKMAAPFPSPPDTVAERVREGDIILGFPI